MARHAACATSVLSQDGSAKVFVACGSAGEEEGSRAVLRGPSIYLLQSTGRCKRAKLQ